MSKQSAYFSAENLADRHVQKEIKKALGRLPGVLSVSVNGRTNQLAVDYDSTGTSCGEIEGEIEKMGCEPRLLSREDHTM